MKHVSRRRCVAIATVTALAGCLRFQGGAENSEDETNPTDGALDVELVYDPPETVGESPELAILYEGATDDPTVEVEYYQNDQSVDTFTTTGDGTADIIRHSRAWENGGAATIEITVRDGDVTDTETIEFELTPATSELEVIDLWAENAPQTVDQTDTYAVEYEGAAGEPDIRVEWRLDGTTVSRDIANGREGSDIVPLDYRWERPGRGELIVSVDDGVELVEERMTFAVAPA